MYIHIYFGLYWAWSSVHLASNIFFPGKVWLDDKKSQTVRVETIQVGETLHSKANQSFPQGQEPGFCGLNEPISGQIEYNCAESEQLYGIGYHKVLTILTS